MAATLIGVYTGTTTAGTAAVASVVGDYFIAFAFRDGNATAPSLATGWTNIAFSGANTCSSRLAYKEATSTSTAINDTWANANGLTIHHYRPGTGNTLSIGANAVANGASTTVSYPALTLQDGVSGRSRVVGFAGHRSVDTNLQNAPTGMTNRSTRVDATCEVAGHDTAGTTSWSLQTVSVGGTSLGWQGRTVEVREVLAGTYLIVNDADDGQFFDDNISDSGWEQSAASQGNNAGYDNFVGWRFRNVAVAQGSTVNSASLTIPWFFTAGSGPFGNLYGADVDNLAVWSAANNPRDVAHTSAFVQFTTTNKNVIDVTAIVQEIVSRGGWVSGNSLGLGGGTQGAASNQLAWYEFSGSSGLVGKAELYIDADPPSGGGSISGSASITEAADTVAATGTLPIAGAASPTEAGDTLSGAAKLVLVGAAGVTETDDTLVATVAPTPKTGTASITEATDALSAAASLKLAAAAAITEAADTFSSSATLAIKTAASIVEAGDSVTVTAALAVAGSATITEAGDALSSATALLIKAAASLTESDDAATTAGVLFIAGSASLNDAADTASAAGTLTIVGAASLTSTDALSAAATLLVRAALAATEDVDTLSASGVQAITGSGSVAATEADDALASTAKLALASIVSITSVDTLSAAGFQTVEGIAASFAATEVDDTLSATAFVSLRGSFVGTESADTLASAGRSLLSATLAVSENDDTLSASAKAALAGIFAAVSNDTLSATGSLKLAAVFSAIENDDTLVAAISGRPILAAIVAITEDDDGVIVTLGIRRIRTGRRTGGPTANQRPSSTQPTRTPTGPPLAARPPTPAAIRHTPTQVQRWR